MKSYLFTTDDGRGGVILCDIDTMEDVVPYLQQRFKGVVRVEQGRSEWTLDGGFAEFTPVPVTQALVGGVESPKPMDGAELGLQTENTTLQAGDPVLQDAGTNLAEVESEVVARPSDPEDGSMTGSLF